MLLTVLDDNVTLWYSYPNKFQFTRYDELGRLYMEHALSVSWHEIPNYIVFHCKIYYFRNLENRHTVLGIRLEALVCECHNSQ